jgi:5-methylcytosine-specific restriction protein A
VPRLYTCATCGTPSPSPYGCSQHHRPPSPQGHRSPDRDRSAQRRFRKAVLERDGGVCRGCGSDEDLRACHIVPLAEGGSYEPSNGITRCRSCDRATDPYAR